MHILKALHRGVAVATQPQVLFPLVGVVLLSVVWALAFGMIRLKYAAAEQTAKTSSGELLDTYEAQVVRALSEINHTLNLVKYWHERPGSHEPLAGLRDKGLLPPDLVFVVSIANADGVVTDSTRAWTPASLSNEDYFRGQRDGAAILVGRPPQAGAADTMLRFSRRLSTADGTFDGIVIVAVDASYFVSGYETSNLGRQGVLGLLGADGVFRVRRTGETVSYGDAIEYSTVISDPEDVEPNARILADPKDHVRRWVGGRELFGFPLAVIVGLSIEEQLADAQHSKTGYLWKATLASALLVALITVLGRMSWQLAQSRLREGEAALAHAQRIEYLAYHDGLTGLPNRSLFSKLLSQGIQDARRNNRPLAVAFLDLDRFKRINDTLGHEGGDLLLKEMAVRIKSCVREHDTVARLGGDEFVVLFPDIEEENFAQTAARRILLATAEAFTLVGQEFRVTASIGISIFPQDGLDEQTLTKNADVAMYQAKADGKNNFQFYSDGLNAHSLERLALESGLRRALKLQEFRLHYQARRDLRSGRVTGIEALVRWEHPELGSLPPSQFVHVADETGLIVPLGKWVLKTVCQQSVAWQEQGLPRVAIAVNLTVRQFADEQLVHDVRAVLEATGMDPHLLELELPESVLIHRVDSTLRILTELKKLGVRIAVGNFGTAFSALALLQQFPLDTIKIDRSLISSIAAATTGPGLADAIIAMGKSLSVTVVAEGVETNDQAEFLRLHACDEVQGFYFKRPLPAAEFTQLLLAQATVITYMGKRLGLTSA